MDESALQLQQGLSASVEEALDAQRPVLTHLNGDTSWLLQLPWKDAPLGRSRFNILVDPWFKGVQVDVAKWFSRQWHVVKPSVQSIAELNHCLEDIESLAQRLSSQPREERLVGMQGNKNPYINAVIVSHEFTDHCNKGTLLELDPDTPVFAKKAAADVIRSWCHFTVVKDIPHFSRTAPDWRTFAMNPLPSWLGIVRIVQSLDISNTHAAVIICFNLERGGSPGSEHLEDEPAEAVIYTPHGLPPENVEILSRALPPIRPLVLIHGLHEVFIGWFGQINLGAVNGLECREKCAAKYWVPTHDEVKFGKGLIGYLLRYNALTLEEATLKLEEKRKEQHSIDTNEAKKTEDFQFIELNSGESLLLA